MSIATSEIEKNDIQKTIYNDKFSIINPTNLSDYKVNYLTPDKAAYRKKRTQTFYPKYDNSCVEKNAKSEYMHLYSNFKDKKIL